MAGDKQQQIQQLKRERTELQHRLVLVESERAQLINEMQDLFRKHDRLSSATPDEREASLAELRSAVAELLRSRQRFR